MSYYTNRIQERRFRKQEYKASKAKAMKKSNVSDEELAEILKRTRKDQKNELDMLRKAFRVDASTKHNSNNTRLTEALYNSFVDLAYVILEDARKPRSGERTRGRGPSRITDLPLHLRGKFGSEDRDPNKARERMKKNIAMQNAPEARKGTVASKTKKHYAKLHKRANAGDAKAKELLRRAEMSDTD